MASCPTVNNLLRMMSEGSEEGRKERNALIPQVRKGWVAPVAATNKLSPLSSVFLALVRGTKASGYDAAV